MNIPLRGPGVNRLVGIAAFLTVLAAVIAISGTAHAAPAAADTPSTWYGPYTFWTTNEQNEIPQVMAVAQAGGSGSRVLLWDHDGDGVGLEQQWWLEDAPTGGYFFHPAHNETLCLDDGGHTGNLTKLFAVTCNGSDAQRFTFNASPFQPSSYDTVYNLTPANAPGQCLDVHNGNEGDPVQLWQCNNKVEQNWEKESEL